MAAMLSALTRLHEERPVGMPPVAMACTVNEEFGFTGAKALPRLWQDGPDRFFDRAPDCIVVAEPTELQVVVAHKGLVRWRCHALGRAAHAATPHAGGKRGVPDGEGLAGHRALRRRSCCHARIAPVVRRPDGQRRDDHRRDQCQYGAGAGDDRDRPAIGSRRDPRRSQTASHRLHRARDGPRIAFAARPAVYRGPSAFRTAKSGQGRKAAGGGLVGEWAVPRGGSALRDPTRPITPRPESLRWCSGRARLPRPTPPMNGSTSIRSAALRRSTTASSSRFAPSVPVRFGMTGAMPTLRGHVEPQVASHAHVATARGHDHKTRLRPSLPASKDVQGEVVAHVVPMFFG